MGWPRLGAWPAARRGRLVMLRKCIWTRLRVAVAPRSVHARGARRRGAGGAQRGGALVRAVADAGRAAGAGQVRWCTRPLARWGGEATAETGRVGQALAHVSPCGGAGTSSFPRHPRRRWSATSGSSTTCRCVLLGRRGGRRPAPPQRRRCAHRVLVALQCTRCAALAPGGDGSLAVHVRRRRVRHLPVCAPGYRARAGAAQRAQPPLAGQTTQRLPVGCGHRRHTNATCSIALRAGAAWRRRRRLTRCTRAA